MAKLILNCDLGEDEPITSTRSLLRLVDAANIGCGVHAGDPEKTRRTIELAAAENVCVGAHPGLGEAGGRGSRLPGAVEFRNLLADQVGGFLAAAEALDVPVNHVKLHGVLYQAVEVDDGLAAVYLDFLKTVPGLSVFALAEGCFARRAERAGLRVVHELFADRAYRADGRLAPRTDPGALIEDADAAVGRLRHWSATGQMETLERGSIFLRGQTVCVHGDAAGAANLLSRLKALGLDAQ